jgi:hypothetical protein
MKHLDPFSLCVYMLLNLTGFACCHIRLSVLLLFSLAASSSVPIWKPRLLFKFRYIYIYKKEMLIYIFRMLVKICVKNNENVPHWFCINIAWKSYKGIAACQATFFNFPRKRGWSGLIRSNGLQSSRSKIVEGCYKLLPIKLSSTQPAKGAHRVIRKDYEYGSWFRPTSQSLVGQH